MFSRLHPSLAHQFSTFFVAFNCQRKKETAMGSFRNERASLIAENYRSFLLGQLELGKYKLVLFFFFSGVKFPYLTTVLGDESYYHECPFHF